MPVRNDATFTSGGKPIPVELHRPTPAVTHSALIVAAYGSDGMEDNTRGDWATMIREYAVKLAGKKIAIAIPDYLARTATPPGLAALGAIPLLAGEWQDALTDALAWARALNGIDPTRIGLLGFSLGGHLCLRERGAAKALVEFFAPELTGIGPAPAAPVPHVQIHHGEADDLVHFANAGRIARAMRQEGSAVEVCSYPGAGHGFSGTDPANSAARRQSLERTVAFFSRHL